jgi:hypothetical protein
MAAVAKKKPKRTRILEIYGCPRHVIRPSEHLIFFPREKNWVRQYRACATGQKNGRRKSQNELFSISKRDVCNNDLQTRDYDGRSSSTLRRASHCLWDNTRYALSLRSISKSEHEVFSASDLSFAVAPSSHPCPKVSESYRDRPTNALSTPSGWVSHLLLTPATPLRCSFAPSTPLMHNTFPQPEAIDQSCTTHATIYNIGYCKHESAICSLFLYTRITIFLPHLLFLPISLSLFLFFRNRI